MKRFAIAMLGATVAACALAAVPAAAGVRMSHTVTIEGELVNNWTMQDEAGCGASTTATGTLTVKFRTTTPTRVLPYVDRFQRAESGRWGNWFIGVPLPPGLLKHMPAVPVTGTITRVDNTVRPPPDEGDDCTNERATAGCGTFPLRRVRAGISGYSRTSIMADLGGGDFLYPRRTCLAGRMESWSDHRFTGGPRNAEGELVVKMPRPAALKRRRVVRVRGSSHKRTAADGEINDVTRRVTVTFRRR
jgi:hypothetical protein